MNLIIIVGTLMIVALVSTLYERLLYDHGKDHRRNRTTQTGETSNPNWKVSKTRSTPPNCSTA